jgi:hypothetical protein
VASELTIQRRHLMLVQRKQLHQEKSSCAIELLQSGHTVPRRSSEGRRVASPGYITLLGLTDVERVGLSSARLARCVVAQYIHGSQMAMCRVVGSATAFYLLLETEQRAFRCNEFRSRQSSSPKDASTSAGAAATKVRRIRLQCPLSTHVQVEEKPTTET